MSRRIINIDPITRISGFLEIKVQVENNKITNAQCSGLLYRGFEKMLKGKHPLDAIYFTERICGICSTAHSYVSTLALENALGVTPVENSKIVRDFIHGCEFLQNHLRHFYLYAIPDYVNAPQIHPIIPNKNTDYRLPKKLNEKLGRSYVEAIKYSRISHELLALLGGKAPHNHGIFVGGATVNINAYKIIKAQFLLDSIKQFIENTMVEDVQIIANYYSDYFKVGSGYKNLMSYGLFDQYTDPRISYVNPKVSINNELLPLNPNNIEEDSYYVFKEDGTILDCDSVESNSTISSMDSFKKDNPLEEGSYSFIKAPRYDGLPMEVGPLARMYLSGNYTNGISTMDRLIARVMETKKIANIMDNMLKIMKSLPSEQGRYDIPFSSKGRGLSDTTRGALGHWISIDNKTISAYNIITPSNWNLSPKDSLGLNGVVEKALIGTEINDTNAPIELGRIVRSFDPCVSCATHVAFDNRDPIEIIIE